MNFGYSKADYEALTQLEKLFIMKAYENKTVEQTTYIRNAVLNAVSNALRKKNKRFVDLWKKAQKPLDKEKAQVDLSVVLETEKKEGKDWVSRIYEANGMQPPKREEVTDG